jgi:hypothetical protein
VFRLLDGAYVSEAWSDFYGPRRTPYDWPENTFRSKNLATCTRALLVLYFALLGCVG